MKIDSDPANLAVAREAVEQLCKAAGFDENAIHEVGLCVNEAHANVIRHAYDNATDRPIEISATFDGQKVIVTIRDWGNGINPAELPPGKRDPMTPGGLGLVCMEKMLDEARFEPQADGMLLTMTRRRNRAA